MINYVLMNSNINLKQFENVAISDLNNFLGVFQAIKALHWHL